MNLAGLSGQAGDVPPEVDWPPPDDGAGVYAGAWRLLELLCESDEFDESDELDPLEVPEPEFCEPEPTFAVPDPSSADEELPVPVLADEPP
jgi:hypothetical protein